MNINGRPQYHSAGGAAGGGLPGDPGMEGDNAISTGLMSQEMADKVGNVMLGATSMAFGFPIGKAVGFVHGLS